MPGEGAMTGEELLWLAWAKDYLRGDAQAKDYLRGDAQPKRREAMKKPDCSHCPARNRCCLCGATTARQLRETIKALRGLLAVVSKCPTRKKWDGKRGAR